jgi:branched-chain amino acid transport system ATP-binding protein
MLSIKNLHSGYNGVEIVHGIDFELGAGEIGAIIGPNGSGKSTFLKSIFNLCSVYFGEINFKGKNITSLKTHELILEGISFVPQGRMVFSDLTVKENLQMGAFSISDAQVVEKNLDSVYSKFPFLKKKENDYAFTLSGGQQQLLAIGRALIQSPSLILLDEPSLGLSPVAMKEVFNKIKEINKEGVSVIIVEQNAKQAVKIADKTYVLEQGKVAFSGRKGVLSNEKIKKVYFGGE